MGKTDDEVDIDDVDAADDMDAADDSVDGGDVDEDMYKHHSILDEVTGVEQITCPSVQSLVGE